MPRFTVTLTGALDIDLRVCAHARCNRPFLTADPRARYCQEKCKKAEQMVRYRQRHVKEGQ